MRSTLLGDSQDVVKFFLVFSWWLIYPKLHRDDMLGPSTKGSKAS